MENQSKRGRKPDGTENAGAPSEGEARVMTFVPPTSFQFVLPGWKFRLAPVAPYLHLCIHFLGADSSLATGAWAGCAGT